jgi:hypothetical protein
VCTRADERARLPVDGEDDAQAEADAGLPDAAAMKLSQAETGVAMHVADRCGSAQKNCEDAARPFGSSVRTSR